MRIPGLLLAVLGATLATHVAAIGQSQQREKVAEGKYGKYRDGKLIDANQSWVLWRAPDGEYELEDRFHVADPVAELASQLGSSHLSAKLREELKGQLIQTELNVRLSASLDPKYLEVKGTRLQDGKPVDVASCAIEAREISCKGLNGGAKMKRSGSRQFFFSFPFPMLAGGLLQRAPKAVGEQVSMNLTVMSLVPSVGKPKIKLTNCAGALTFVGQEQIELGDRSYKVDKYVLEVFSKAEPLKLTFWSNKTLIVAVEAASIPGERMQLTEYKKFSEF